MTTIRDPHETARGAQLLADRWAETKPAETRPFRAGQFIHWTRPSFTQRLANAWRAACAELAR